MKPRTLIAIGLLSALATVHSCYTQTQETDYASLVNPFIGTDYTGNTYPGAQAPFGMVQLSPDNGLPGWDRIAGYFYPDSTIAGFSHTHLSGTGAGDLYDISFMPVTLPVREAEAPLGIHSRFSHDRECASAGYYRVHLSDYDIDVELTATERCGIQRYTFPEGRSAIVLNLTKATNWDATTDWNVTVIDSVTIEGHRFSTGWARDQHLWFRSRFSHPFDSIGTDSITWFYFNTTPGQQITVSTALSCTGTDGARLNLDTEVPTDDFDRSLALTREAWNKALGRFVAESDCHDDIVNFYTALYHSMLAPTIYCDTDGRYRGPDKQNHQAEGWVNYGTFSLWDTYRAAHPLYTIMDPVRAGHMAQSLLAFGKQNGRMPVWNFQGSETDMMIGYHSVPVIVDAYLKGLTSFDANDALDACMATARLDSYRDIGQYRSLGYVAADADADEWALSKTLEYAYDDWCIAIMADTLGRKAEADEFYQRAQNWRNVFNPATGFMQPRLADGSFKPGFHPGEYSRDICESNAWQYLWSVQHDIPGLIQAMGAERFALQLDSMMTASHTDDLPIFSTGMIGQYAHGNEPSHHVIYLHNMTGRRHLTQKYVAQVMNELYLNSPAGLCGNEDCGQMSAWFVFSAMGFYPVNPVGGTYELGTPLFPSLTLHLPDSDKTFRVVAHNLSKDNIYVNEVRYNGQPVDKSFITHDMIMAGGTLEFYMTGTPQSAAAL